MVSKKLRIIFGVLFAVGMISVIGIGFEISQAQEPTEIDQNQVDDEISQTIYVKLHDGISSSDDFQ